MEKLFITQPNGSKIEVTDLKKALKQTYQALNFHVHKLQQRAKTGEGIIYPTAKENWEHHRDQLEELRSNQLTVELTAQGWTCTDPSCNQFCKPVSKIRFQFREDRIINPETKEREVYESEINLFNYSAKQIYDACISFGYKKEEVKGWIKDDKNTALVAECLFELEG